MTWKLYLNRKKAKQNIKRIETEIYRLGKVNMHSFWHVYYELEWTLDAIYHIRHILLAILWCWCWSKVKVAMNQFIHCFWSVLSWMKYVPVRKVARLNDRFVKPKLPQNFYYFEIYLLEFPVCCLIKRFGILGICVKTKVWQAHPNDKLTSN